MRKTYPDIVPRNAEELMVYRNYIIGGLRNQNVPEDEIDDRLQDMVVHCMQSNFFVLVAEKADAGEMTPKQFRSYLGQTIHNCLRNWWKKENRNPAIGAISTDVSGDEDENRRVINLERTRVDEAEIAIPASVMESDIIRFVAERKPGFLPTLILYLQGWRPADISRIIGKRKETVHYRMKAITALLREWADEQERGKEGTRRRNRTQTITGPTYHVKGKNPFKRGSSYQIFETLKAVGRPVTMKELTIIVGRLMDQGKFNTTRTPEEVAGSFIAYALEKDAIGESAAPTSGQGSGGRASHGAPRTRYKITTQTNPYKWGGGKAIFEQLKGASSFDFDTLLSVVQGLRDGGSIDSKRIPEDIAWGFIDTARGYNVLERDDDLDLPMLDDQDDGTSQVTAYYRFCKPNPFKRNINFEVWNHLHAMGIWTREQVDETVGMLLRTRKIKSIRKVDDIAYNFFHTMTKYKADHIEEVADSTTSVTEVPIVSSSPTYSTTGDCPFCHGIHFKIWQVVQDKVWTRKMLEGLVEQMLVAHQLKSKRSPYDIAHSFYYESRNKDAIQAVPN